MAHNISCYRCGASLSELSLPLSRQDECPKCRNYLHVCLMCSNFDKLVPKQCREDDAEEVSEKARLNFCEWYVPSENAFNANASVEEDRAKSELDALFSENADKAADTSDSSALSEADRLFK